VPDVVVLALVLQTKCCLKFRMEAPEGLNLPWQVTLLTTVKSGVFRTCSPYSRKSRYAFEL